MWGQISNHGRVSLWNPPKSEFWNSMYPRPRPRTLDSAAMQGPYVTCLDTPHLSVIGFDVYGTPRKGRRFTFLDQIAALMHRLVAG